ncbi:MAG: leucine--tRNA ligase [Thaumarchaeota archaeon]|nr:leucine--tRNA ligase [Nitrososphaerota archaeon]
MDMNWSEMEAKWRSKWQESHDFEAEPSSKEKKFITVAYPYPNSPQHIGHGRTYTIADVHARFCRMKGYNVLFPMGFHYTGTPILGMAKRVEAGDVELLDGLREIYHVPEEDIKTFVKPVKIADYFHEEIKSGMIEMGYSIDWRREFTTILPAYQKFIEWQIDTLEKKSLIIQGSHPVGWCPKDQNPVSQHDTLGDVEPDFTEYILVKFRLGEYVIPTATLRPETIFGVTNLWVNPNTIYKKIRVDGEKWIVSSQCAYKMEFLDKKIEYDGDIPGSELIGKNASAPHKEVQVPILEASFVESGTGTGLVMSVPAHAPFDYQALVDFKKNQPLSSEFQLLKPISIISVDGYGEFPAKDACEKFSIKDQDDPKLDDATDEIYGKEFYGGTLKDACDKFAGTKVSESKDVIKEWLSQNEYSDILLEMTNSPVRCRCGAECVVKILSNQWFLNYGDAKWKDMANVCLDEMGVLPQEIVGEFHHTVGWLRERACARQHGLGTRLPFDKDWIVESLSDSVIYMAYYTISRFVNDGTIQADNMSKKFFDYIFLGLGEASDISGISPHTLEKIRAEFEYFYPVDSRHSGRDLVPNHLTFFVLNHVAIFPEKHWPQQIVVNGSVLMDGKKMSKSMGNIIPLRQAVREHGADPIRLAILISAELLQDADFNLESVGGIKSKLEAVLAECSKLKPEPSSITETEDKWIASILQRLVVNASASMEKMRLREALHDILFAFEDEIQWYLKRAHAKGRSNYMPMLHDIYSTRVAMLSPFAPHIAEEMWQKLGNPGMVSKSSWPAVNKAIDLEAVQSEHFLKSVMSDIANILKVTKITPKNITIYTAGQLKSSAYYLILNSVASGKTNMGEVMKELIANPETEKIKNNPDFVQKAIKDILSIPTEIRDARMQVGKFDEKRFMSAELEAIAKTEFGAKVSVFVEGDSDSYDPKEKAKHSRPFKPAILIE